MVIISENLSLTLLQISDKNVTTYEEFVINSDQFWYLLQVILDVNECLDRYEIKYKNVYCTYRTMMCDCGNIVQDILLEWNFIKADISGIFIGPVRLSGKLPSGS